MAESRQAINDMPLYWMPHDVQQQARLGSLDFLSTSKGKGKAHHLPMFPEATEGPERRTGRGEAKHDVFMPECDLVIANPPYTRAGGPGSAENTAWNPIFGSVLSKGDAETMNRTLQRTLANTPASMYAGLGSAFVVLADEKLKPGGRLAFVLPATGMSRALLKLSGSLVHDYATIADDSPSPNRASRARRAATSAGIS